MRKGCKLLLCGVMEAQQSCHTGDSGLKQGGTKIHLQLPLLEIFESCTLYFFSSHFGFMHHWADLIVVNGGSAVSIYTYTTLCVPQADGTASSRSSLSWLDEVGRDTRKFISILLHEQVEERHVLLTQHSITVLLFNKELFNTHFST